MADRVSREKRSYIMSRIRGKWTEPELKVHNMLKGLKIKHKMHPKIEGGPDIILKDRKVAIFIHGCFWHKCPKCYSPPKSNREYWLPKIRDNVKRDKNCKKKLKQAGYKVVVIWEHEIREDFLKVKNKVISVQ
jgi:DNA mismatch endonuclease (patch repair protein)